MLCNLRFQSSNTLNQVNSCFFQNSSRKLQLTSVTNLCQQDVCMVMDQTSTLRQYLRSSGFCTEVCIAKSKLYIITTGIACKPALCITLLKNPRIFKHLCQCFNSISSLHPTSAVNLWTLLCLENFVIYHISL